ncbi:hypothetical protein B0T16DRAFT_332564 [Cercophora newfieldiana]|uniref:DUF7580 domain-containing protein n=1 Tax=Cercophora newfieldiana TaxID=92897 RepID=A0AA39Y1Y7_9PEZI|nr:hypothetical protein B0T16DRAFT_332564 [Cercophora newfieldiana]
MSGIEVAGLVLGAFPVAIWALERYRDVARVMGFWYEIRLEYQRSSNELKFHRLSFVRNLKQLLLPIVSDDSQLKRLIDDPGGDAWKDPAIQTALQTRLQDSYGLYLDILHEMERVMHDLNKELATDSDKVQSNLKDAQTTRTRGLAASRFKQSFDRSNRSYQAFRVKFSVGEQTRTQLFAEFQTYNDRLEKLVASSDIVSELEDARQKNKPSSEPATTAITRFWRNADKLYRAFFAAWTCGCRDHHCAQLVLQHRSSPADRDFSLHLASGTERGGSNHIWSTCSLMIRTLEKVPPNLVERLSEISLQGSERSLPAASSSAHRAKRPAKSVRFGISPEPSPTLPPSPPPSIHTPTISSDIITNLCHTLDSGISSITPSSLDSEPIGYLVVETSDIRFAIHPTPDASMIVNHSHISLFELLSGDQRPSLTRRQRYRLSLVLASSFVQLKDTAWLQRPWDKRNVHFTSSNRREDTPNLDSPFIISRFGDSEPSRITWSGATQPGGHDVAGIACLGILLLELCFGRLIENHPSRPVLPDGVGGDSMRAALDLIAALEWLKDVNDEAGADYTEAVEWCLAGCRTLPSDGSWRKLMVERVVVPLENCYKYLG